MKRFIGVLALLVACGGETTAPPTPGTIVLSLGSPGVNDGAIVVVVSGGPVNVVHPAGDLELARQSDGSGTHLMLVGDVAEGVLATIEVPDISRASAYVATVEQVADRTTFALLDPAPYHVTITVSH
ncbi:MAG: hypothetical protein V4503_10200 [Gemmatimonadota bacterium]